MKMNRRTFFKGAGLLAGSVALGGLAACSSNGGGDANGSNQSTDQADSIEVSETLTCDIVVVGGGISGLSAALEGAQQGAHVVLVEKQPEIGGNSLGAEGPFAVNSVIQREAGVDLKIYDALKNELELSNYRTDSQIWINYLRHSGDNISWLLDNGVKFVDVRACNAGLVGWHYYDGGGSAAVAAIKESADKAGVEFLTSTPMKQLMIEGGEVKGIIADREGEMIAIEAKGVVLASGGTGANTETLSERTGFDCTNATISCSPGNTGDGMTQAIAAGADSRTACIMGDKCVQGYGMFDHISFASTRQPILWVNGFGERFVNEGIVVEDIPSAFNSIFIGQKACYSVLDQATVDRFAAGDCPDRYSNYMPDLGDELPDLKEQIEAALASNVNNVFAGDTVAELAENMGVPADALEETIAEYNEVCARGEDTDFYKNAEFLIPVSEGPFYAFKIDPLVVCAIGGLCTNVDNQVLDPEGTPIPNLYAVGLDGCNLYEETYNMMLGGSCNGYCIYSGRNAAQHILA